MGPHFGGRGAVGEQILDAARRERSRRPRRGRGRRSPARRARSLRSAGSSLSACARPCRRAAAQLLRVVQVRPARESVLQIAATLARGTRQSPDQLAYRHTVPRSARYVCVGSSVGLCQCTSPRSEARKRTKPGRWRNVRNAPRHSIVRLPRFKFREKSYAELGRGLPISRRS
jgi:hypothetical protein